MSGLNEQGPSISYTYVPEAQSCLTPWLAVYPKIKSVSQLALDAGRTGLLDFSKSWGTAVIRDANQIMAGLIPQRSVEYRARQAEAAVDAGSARCELAIEEDTIVLHGSVAPGVAVYETRRFSALLIDTIFPETVLSAMVGRRVDEVVSLPLTADRDYLILAAATRPFGIALKLAFRQMSLVHAELFSDSAGRE